MERTREQKRQDIKAAIDTMRLLIGVLEDQTITSLERADGAATIIHSVIVRMREEYKGDFAPCVCPDFDRRKGCVASGDECNRLESI